MDVGSRSIMTTMPPSLAAQPSGESILTKEAE
jgi:hypothetical protein